MTRTLKQGLVFLYAEKKRLENIFPKRRGIFLPELTRSDSMEWIMEKWEYHLIMHSFKYGEIDKNHVRELNLLGQAGWDLVSVTRINEEQAQYSFKRSVEQR